LAKRAKRDEPQLTRALAEAIEAKHSETGFHSDIDAKIVWPAAELESTDDGKISGRIDILLTPEEKDSKTKSTPFAIIEVGRHDNEWWKRLDQNTKYLAAMGTHQRDTRLGFSKPLIFAVLTIEGEGEDEVDSDGANGKVSEDRRLFVYPREQQQHRRLSNVSFVAFTVQ
jgi:hypothetical protein